MKMQELMSGIGIVIDDMLSDGMVLTGEVGQQEDPIDQIARWFMDEWEMPLFCMQEPPKKVFLPSLMQSASFVLLDWKLWGDGGAELKVKRLGVITALLLAAMENLVPVIILTNESPDDVKSELKERLEEEYDKSNSINLIVERKGDFWSGESVRLEKLEK